MDAITLAKSANLPGWECLLQIMLVLFFSPADSSSSSESKGTSSLARIRIVATKTMSDASPLLSLLSLVSASLE